MTIKIYIRIWLKHCISRNAKRKTNYTNDKKTQYYGRYTNSRARRCAITACIIFLQIARSFSKFEISCDALSSVKYRIRCLQIISTFLHDHIRYGLIDTHPVILNMPKEWKRNTNNCIDVENITAAHTTMNAISCNNMV